MGMTSQLSRGRLPLLSIGGAFLSRPTGPPPDAAPAPAPARAVPPPDFTYEEARDLVDRVEVFHGRKLSRRMRNNVIHYLVGDFETRHTMSMFGDGNTFAHDGVGIFWQNVVGESIPYYMLPVGEYGSFMSKKNVRFANNDGLNFEVHRDIAMELFWELYDNLLKES